MVGVNKCFGGLCYLHLQGWSMWWIWYRQGKRMGTISIHQALHTSRWGGITVLQKCWYPTTTLQGAITPSPSPKQILSSPLWKLQISRPQSCLSLNVIQTKLHRLFKVTFCLHSKRLRFSFYYVICTEKTTIPGTSLFQIVFFSVFLIFIVVIHWINLNIVRYILIFIVAFTLQIKRRVSKFQYGGCVCCVCLRSTSQSVSQSVSLKYKQLSRCIKRNIPKYT
jgi:hypothetical protein